MKKYKSHSYVYLLQLFSMLFFVALYVVEIKFNNNPLDVILVVVPLLAVFNFIYSFNLRHVINEKGIVYKTIMSTTSLDWIDVEYIYKEPPSKLVKESIAIYGCNKKITVSNWTKNYKELLKIAIKESKKHNENVRINEDVFRIINE